MPRGRKAGAAVAAKRKGRKAKESKGSNGEFNASELLTALRKKYPDQHFVTDSLQDVKGTGEFANKRSVEIKCQFPGCDAHRRIATSDAHQVKHCEPHIKEVRLQRRKAQRAASAKGHKHEGNGKA